jgi:5-methylcytosine-specific restriction protein A
MTQHRRPPIPFSDAPRGTCRWCGEPILHADGDKGGHVNRRRRWHPRCAREYNASDPREARRRVRRRDRGLCRECCLDTVKLRRELRGKGMTAKLRDRGFKPRKSLWELDHIVPLIDGGGHELENLQTLCVPCHERKTAAEARARAKRRQRPDTESRARRSSRDDEERLESLLSSAERANQRLEASLRELGEGS